jgi:hypothetical protein
MTAKALTVAPIKSVDATAFVRRNHYSGAVAANSQLHFGVFWNNKLEGALQFGPPIDKRKVIGLVSGTHWNGFLELNRMAFTEKLPRNSESRAIAVAMRLIRKHYPHIEWVLSFSDASQCGDGTIYRASGFVLTGIKPNRSIIKFPDGETHASISITNDSGKGASLKRRLCAKWGVPYFSGAKVSPFFEIGAQYVEGFQLQYLYFMHSKIRERLTVSVLPFSEIERHGAKMYKGKRMQASEGKESSRSATSGKKGGASPTLTLQPAEEV